MHDTSKCNKIFEGYILRIFENAEKPFTLYTADYFFCDSLPSFADTIDFNLLLKKFPLFYERYYDGVINIKHMQYDVLQYYF